jgi:hypothetical protein
MAIAFISNSRVSMQRAGMLAAISAASTRETSNLDKATRGLSQIVRRQVELATSEVDSFGTYMRSLRLWKRYGHLRSADRVEPGDKVDLQDLWLSDPALPSATGAVTDEVMSDIPQLAVSLRLLRKGNLSQTDRGKALVEAYGAEQVATLVREGRSPNLLALPTAAQLIVAYAMLENDGDFLRAAWRTTPVLGLDEFKRSEFATGLQRACDLLVDQARQMATTGADRQLIARLREWSAEIAKGRRSGAKWGGGRPPDQLATLRLEPYVDLGLIERVVPNEYLYRINGAQGHFFQQLADAEDVVTFARNHLVGHWLQSTGRSGRRIASEDEIWSRIRDAYLVMRSRLGFAPFIEVVLLAVGALIDEDDDRYFEIENGVDVILEQRRRKSKEVRLTINRGGELTYMKIVEGAKRQ